MQFFLSLELIVGDKEDAWAMDRLNVKNKLCSFALDARSIGECVGFRPLNRAVGHIPFMMPISPTPFITSMFTHEAIPGKGIDYGRMLNTPDFHRESISQNRRIADVPLFFADIHKLNIHPLTNP